MTLPDMRFGPTELRLRPLGIGTNSWGARRGEGEDATRPRAAFEAAMSNGVRLIDTAEVYNRGRSERVIGRILAGSHEPALVATKFAPLPYRLTSSSLEGALDASLRRLQRETVDLYQIHFPFTLLRIRSLMDRLADAVAAGKVRYVGVSNYSAAQMRTAHAALAERGVPLVSNQVNYSLCHRAPEENGVLETCHELDVTLIAYFPLARGVLTGKHQGGAPAPRGLGRFSARLRKPEQLQPHLQPHLQPLLRALDEIGQTHGRTPGQVALNWLARQERVLPIPGARHARQARENAGAIDFAISDDEAARLADLSAELP